MTWSLDTAILALAASAIGNVMLIVFLVAMLRRDGFRQKRLYRAEGAMIRLFSIMRGVPADPSSRLASYDKVERVVDEWFTEAMLGVRARKRRVFNDDRQTSMEEDGATFDGAVTERSDG